MKVIVTFALVFCLAACFAVQSLAVPAGNPDGDQSVDGGLEAPTKIKPEVHGRYKRATCDLFSAAGVSHTACAAHCLLIGYHGGYCNSKAICVCRN